MKVYQYKFLVTLFISVFHFSLFAQVKSVSKSSLQKQMQFVLSQEKVNADDFFIQTSNKMGLGQSNEMILKSELSGKNNYTYKKYEQSYKGVPVFGSAYTLRVQNGYVKRASGYYLPFIDIKVQPEISSEQALRISMQIMKAKEYTWQNEGLTKIPSYAKEPIPKLVIIDANYPASSEYYKLAYQVDLQSTDPLDKKRYFIDAQTGQMLLNLPMLNHQAVPSKGQTKYYGEQSFTVDSVGQNEFILLDPTRGKGNAVYNSDGEIFKSSENYWDLFNLAQDEVAIDAHYCTERFYDLMLNTFDWDGIDNEGGSLNCIVHAGDADFVNAFWDGITASFGDGDCNHGPLTTYEIVAHEFMHGITENTSMLIYASESGAINESMSDVFGKALEYYEDPDHFNWDIGQSFSLTEFTNSFRSFENPNIFEHPKYYLGEFWSEVGSSVHTNSSVGNHWFYLLVNGGEGINEVGSAYDIQGIGMEKALQIVFLVQSTALVPNSNYPFYYESSIIAASEIHGDNSEEVLAVQKAWNAVGVDTASVPEDIFDIRISTEGILRTCVKNENVELEFQVVNRGTQPYNPNLGGAVILTYQNDALEEFSKLIPLNQEILPGESMTLKVDDFVFIEEEKRLSVRLRINFDLSFPNSITILNSIYPANDLQLVSDVAEFSAAPACLNGEVEMEFRVINKSCEVIPTGSPFELVFYDVNNNPISSQNYSLPFDLGRDVPYSILANLNSADVGSNLNRVEVYFANDPDELNNTIPLSISDLEVINTEYAQTFDGVELDKIDLAGELAYDVSLPFNYQNENYFAAGGNMYFDDRSLCADFEEYFKEDRISLQMCIDTKDMTNPSLGFDLIQFRDGSDIEFQELINNTNIVKVSWTDGQNDFVEYIAGQDEGVLQNHIFELPIDARGIAKIEFYNKSGRTNFNSALTDSDIALLDNLKISDEIASSVNSTQAVDFGIQPNPSRGLFQISYPKTPDALILTNIHGQEVLNISPKVNTQELDISHLPDGNYAITLIYPEGISSSIFVKIGR